HLQSEILSNEGDEEAKKAKRAKKAKILNQNMRHWYRESNRRGHRGTQRTIKSVFSYVYLRRPAAGGCTILCCFDLALAFFAPSSPFTMRPDFKKERRPFTYRLPRPTGDYIS